MDGLREKIKEFLKTYEGRKPRGEEDEMDEMYSDQVASFFYDVVSEFDLEVGFTACENSSDVWIEQYVFVPQLVGDRGYNIILDVDSRRHFDNEEDFVEWMVACEDEAQKFLYHFKK